MVDNKSAIALMKNPVHHDRSKHIDVKFHFIQECCDKKLIDVEFVGTELQLGDMLTKALAHSVHRAPWTDRHEEISLAALGLRRRMFEKVLSI